MNRDGSAREARSLPRSTVRSEGGAISAEPVRPDIADRVDIAGLVTEFYRRAFADDLLGPAFVDVAQVDLSAHLPAAELVTITPVVIEHRLRLVGTDELSATCTPPAAAPTEFDVLPAFRGTTVHDALRVYDAYRIRRQHPRHAA